MDQIIGKQQAQQAQQEQVKQVYRNILDGFYMKNMQTK